eukprot:762760-Hanusia_phi.AAC.7
MAKHLVQYNASEMAEVQTREENLIPVRFAPSPHAFTDLYKVEYSHFWQHDELLSSRLEVLSEKSLLHAKICGTVLPSRMTEGSSRHDAQAVGCCILQPA